MTSQPKALAVIRRQSGTPNIYEAWLHHQPKISSRYVGIWMTKNLLQFAANQSKTFPVNPITSLDIEAALATEGSEVMVYYVIKGHSFELPTRKSNENYFIDIEEESSEEKVPAIDRQLPPSSPPRPPLPPILEPPTPVTNEKLLAVSKMDIEYRRLVNGCAFAPDPNAYGKATLKGVTAKAEQPTLVCDYDRIAEEFAASCSNAAKLFVSAPEG